MFPSGGGGGNITPSSNPFNPWDTRVMIIPAHRGGSKTEHLLPTQRLSLSLPVPPRGNPTADYHAMSEKAAGGFSQVRVSSSDFIFPKNWWVSHSQWGHNSWQRKGQNYETGAIGLDKRPLRMTKVLSSNPVITTYCSPPQFEWLHVVKHTFMQTNIFPWWIQIWRQATTNWSDRDQHGPNHCFWSETTLFCSSTDLQKCPHYATKVDCYPRPLCNPRFHFF